MPRPRNARRWIVVLASIAVLGVVLALRVARPTEVAVEPVVRGRAVEAVYATGTVEPLERVEVRSRLSEHVERVLVKEGQAVTAGQLLARIDTPVRRFALSQTQTQLAKARQQAGPRSPQLANLEAQARALASQLALARLDLTRTEQLFARAAATQQELDSARYRAAQLEAQSQAAEAQLASSRLELGATAAQLAVQVQSLAAEADEGAVTSPLAGIVLRRAVEPGEVVSQNQSLFEIADVSTLIVELKVDEADIARVRDGREPAAGAGSAAAAVGSAAGDAAPSTADSVATSAASSPASAPASAPTGATKVALSFFAFPGRAFSGTVAEILPEPDRQRRSYTVKVRLDEPVAGLRVGMTAEANLIVARKDQALLLPAEALDGGYAWFAENGRAVRRQVMIGIRDLTRVELLAGATEGALAITDAAARKLRPGAKVAPQRRAP